MYYSTFMAIANMKDNEDKLKQILIDEFDYEDTYTSEPLRQRYLFYSKQDNVMVVDTIGHIKVYI